MEIVWMKAAGTDVGRDAETKQMMSEAGFALKGTGFSFLTRERDMSFEGMGFDPETTGGKLTELGWTWGSYMMEEPDA